jgi:hypothetical protein
VVMSRGMSLTLPRTRPRGHRCISSDSTLRAARLTFDSASEAEGKLFKVERGTQQVQVNAMTRTPEQRGIDARRFHQLGASTTPGA